MTNADQVISNLSAQTLRGLNVVVIHKSEADCLIDRVKFLEELSSRLLDYLKEKGTTDIMIPSER